MASSSAKPTDVNQDAGKQLVRRQKELTRSSIVSRSSTSRDAFESLTVTAPPAPAPAPVQAAVAPPPPLLLPGPPKKQRRTTRTTRPVTRRLGSTRPVTRSSGSMALRCGTKPMLFGSTSRALEFRRTGSGRVIVPRLDCATHEIIYGMDGSISGVLGPDGIQRVE